MSDSRHLLYPLQDVFCFPWYWILLFHHCNVIIKYVMYELFMHYKRSIYNKLPDLMRDIRKESTKIARSFPRFEYIDVSLQNQYLLEYQQQFKYSLDNYINIPDTLQTLIYTYIFGIAHITSWDAFCAVFMNDDRQFHRSIVSILQTKSNADLKSKKLQSQTEFERKVSTLKTMKLVATCYTWLHIIIDMAWLVLFVVLYINYYDAVENAWVAWILLFCHHPLFSFTLLVRYYKTWQYWDVLNNAMHMCCKSTGNVCLPCLFSWLCCPCYGYITVLLRCKADIKETTDGVIKVDKYEFNPNHYQMRRIYLTNIKNHKKVKQFVFMYAAMILCLCWGVALPLMMISMLYYFVGFIILHGFVMVGCLIVGIILYALCRPCIPESTKDDKEGIVLVLFFTFWIHCIHVFYIAAYGVHVSSDQPVNTSVISAFTGSYCDKKDLYVFDGSDWRALFLFVAWIL
eukprot:120882_1